MPGRSIQPNLLFIADQLTLTKSPSRYFFIDVLRAVAIIAVVLMHNSADYVDKYGKIPLSDWISASFFNGVTRFCVPMFVMLSGSLLLNKDLSIRELFTRRLPRLIIPLIIWSIVYVTWQNYTWHSFTTFSIANTLLSFYRGPVIFHFWFLYMMIGIYLIYPVINGFVRSATESQLIYFLAGCFVVNCIIGISEILTDAWSGFDTSGFLGYVGYFALGSYVANAKFPKQSLKVIYILSVAGMLLSVGGIFILEIFHFKKANDLIESDFTPEMPFVIAGMFLYLKSKNISNTENSWWKTCINAVSKESYGIYIVHVLIMQVIFLKTFPYLQFDNLSTAFSIPLKTAIMVLLSYLLIRLIRLIPLVRATV